MNHHQYPQVPPHGPYIPPQLMGPPPPHPPLPHQHHHHHHHQPPQHPHPHHQGSYQLHPQHVHPYAQHQHLPHPGSQAADFRPQQFAQANRPLIVSTPASYIPQYPHMMPHPMSGSFYRLPQIHPGMQSFYSQQDLPPQPPPDIHSPASLPQEPPTSNPDSSPSRSVGVIEEPSEPRYETPITSSSSVPPSPMVPHVLPLSAGTSFKPPKLPWYSAPGQSFPARKAKLQKKANPPPSLLENAHQLLHTAMPEADVDPFLASGPGLSNTEENPPNDQDTAETDSTEVDQTSSQLTENVVPVLANKLDKSAPRPVVPVPVVPFIPAIHKARKSTENATGPAPLESEAVPEPTANVDPSPQKPEDAKPAAEANIAPPAPKSWADLVKSTSTQASTTPSRYPPSSTNGILTAVANAGEGQGRTIADVLQSFTIPLPGVSRADWAVPLVEPRGLINTGNMCFMNSILQALLFCGPFYMFLDAISRNVAHNFKSETPLIDSMIIFLREFRRVQPIVTNGSVEKAGAEPALAGSPFVPEYVYEAVKGLKRFSSMRRGHQQDAEEFLNFFLDVLHEECVAAMKTDTKAKQGPGQRSRPEPTAEDNESGWLEVGHKQKAAVTRSVGHISGVSPVTKIFGGQMRNELRVSGQRSSVMREPYQSLQLDIQGSDVSNIVDAIRQIGIPEQLQGGDFKSARGASASATKQALIDSLPPVLILHLKRFQYNNTGGTQKIWKGIGYPLELEIPSEVLIPARRSASNPNYKLIGVVYHHGKSATNGHYTVDVRRQDGWLRIDDTIVKRISEGDVVGGGFVPSRESQINGGSSGNGENGWREVSFATKAGGKASSSGTSQPVKEDKVAYLLFYELQ